jgi:2-C-methyl-D-erythritol 2,4-cyclodiphosphate synthase
MEIRVGFGYDIHRLVEGRPLLLGCVPIPFERGLLGHSDGDAAAHAIADALLGASGLGDLGSHFPASDPRWAGASGSLILEETRKRLHDIGVAVAQVDLTIVAEAPPLAPHRGLMVQAIARALGCHPTVISVKARTHDGIGAIGRGEAIAAYALVLVGRGVS